MRQRERGGTSEIVQRLVPGLVASQLSALTLETLGTGSGLTASSVNGTGFGLFGSRGAACDAWLIRESSELQSFHKANGIHFAKPWRRKNYGSVNRPHKTLCSALPALTHTRFGGARTG